MSAISGQNGVMVNKVEYIVSYHRHLFQLQAQRLDHTLPGILCEKGNTLYNL